MTTYNALRYQDISRLVDPKYRGKVRKGIKNADVRELTRVALLCDSWLEVNMTSGGWETINRFYSGLVRVIEAKKRKAA